MRTSCVLQAVYAAAAPVRAVNHFLADDRLRDVLGTSRVAAPTGDVAD
jgi:hypothetical protein